jgi:mannan endo-1,4-beta-mannosidase
MVRFTAWQAGLGIWGARFASAALCATLAALIPGCAADSESLETGISQAATTGTFSISGKELRDENGNRFIIRGINSPHGWYFSESLAALPALSASGANTVRVVWDLDRPECTASGLKTVIERAVAHNMVVIPELHNATGSSDPARLDAMVNYWLRPDVKQVLLDYKRYVLLNIANEWMGEWNRHETWATAYKSAIRRLRDGGLPHVLVIDASGWGQEYQSVANYGSELLSEDPNLLFSIHMYEVYGSAAAVREALDRTAQLPILIGEFGWFHNGQNVDEDAILSETQARGIGWLAWSWKGNGYNWAFLDMSRDFATPNFSVQCVSGQCLNWGERVVNGGHGLKQTSVRASLFGTTPPPSASCSDRIKNGNETGIDCGGACSACAPPPAPSPAPAPAPAPTPSCSDGLQNGTETGVDCGGSCAPCPSSGSTPCAGLCSSPVRFTSANYQSGSLPTTATCHETMANIAGGLCGDMGTRSFWLNGVPVACNGASFTLPPKRNGGYCFQASAGSITWSWFATW